MEVRGRKMMVMMTYDNERDRGELSWEIIGGDYEMRSMGL